MSFEDRLLPQNYIPQLKDIANQTHKVNRTSHESLPLLECNSDSTIHQVLHSVTSAALRALPADAVQEMDKALQLNSINVSKWQAAMIVIQGILCDDESPGCIMKLESNVLMLQF